MSFRVKSRLLLCTVFFFSLDLFLLSSHVVAQKTLLEDTGGYTKSYVVEMSGKVLNETFSGARASIEIALPTPESQNEYLVVVRGFPKLNSRNSFYWNSDGTEMTTFFDQITSDIKRAFMRPPRRAMRCHFFYLSPILLKPGKGLFLTQMEKGIKYMALRRALPTLVFAEAGQMKLRASGNMVSGSIWMKGYDFIEHSYVEYDASFAGEMATRIKPKWQMKEPPGEARGKK